MTIREIWRRLQYLRHRDEFAQDLREEMQLHLELRARKLRTRSVDDAEFAARRQFGNRTAIQEAASENWGWGAWERCAQDLRYAVRTLRKTSAFTSAAVLTLALGLGINTAVFSVVYAVMLRGLPYPEPARLVQFWGLFRTPPPGFVSPEARWGGPARTNNLSAPAFVAIQQESAGFLDLSAYMRGAHNLTGTGKPAQVWGENVTASFFPLLGATAVSGRFFLAEEERKGAAVAVITYKFWQQRMGGDTAVLERSIVLDRAPYRVIGVLAPDFQSPGQIAEAGPSEYFLPGVYSERDLRNYGHRYLNVMGRLKAGISVARAQAEVDAISDRLAREFDDTKKNFQAVVVPLQDDLIRHVGRSLWALLGASGLMVLITCGNVANLLLVRAVARRHETSVRFALGSGRFRVVRQFLFESLLVALIGSGAGLLLGGLLLQVLTAIAPADIPRIHSVNMDWRVFAVSTALATLTGILFGLAPAWQASRTKPAEALKSRQSAGDRAQSRWRTALTVAEVGLAMVLLIGAGLLMKSFVRLAGVDLGFRPEHVLAMSVNLPDVSYGTAAKRLQFFQELDERVRSLPGVQSVAYANRMPLRGGWSTGITLERAKDEIYIGTDCQAVSPGYFPTLGITLLRGRSITDGDALDAPRVGLVNQEFARRFLADLDPIGRRIYWYKNLPVQIVGVVSDIRRAGKDAPIRPELYIPAAQTDVYLVDLSDFAIRAAGDPRQLAGAIQSQIWALDAELPVTSVKTLDQIAGEDLKGRWFNALLLAVFATVAVGLSVIGVFGVLQYSVSQRTPEFGLRIALGAEPGTIRTMVLRQAGRVIVAGVAIGLAGSYVLTRFLESMLFGVGRHDGWTYAAAAALLAVVSVIAASIPAHRGAKVDPIVALRYE